MIDPNPLPNRLYMEVMGQRCTLWPGSPPPKMGDEPILTTRDRQLAQRIMDAYNAYSALLADSATHS